MTLVLIYNPNDTSARWGQSAWDVAVEQGYSGDEATYNHALGQVGNMRAVLDNILGEGE